MGSWILRGGFIGLGIDLSGCGLRVDDTLCSDSDAGSGCCGLRRWQHVYEITMEKQLRKLLLARVWYRWNRWMLC